MTPNQQRIANLGTVEFIRCGVIVSVEIQKQRRDSVSDHPHLDTRHKRTHIGLRVAATLLLALFIGASSARPAAPRRIEVTAKRFAFEPAEITVKKGEAVELELTSVDVPHGLRIRELKIDLRVNKGKKADAVFTPQTTGTFVGHCSVFCGSGHGEMTLTIHVVA
jgi:cytochrome c oxidase subunit II